MKRCQKCGFELPDGMKFCGKCGTVQQAQPAYQQPTAPANYKKGRIKRIIIGIESILLLISVFFVPYCELGSSTGYYTVYRFNATWFSLIICAVVVLLVAFVFKGFFTGKESAYKMLRNIAIIGIIAEVISLLVVLLIIMNYRADAAMFIPSLIWLAIIITAELGAREERN